MLLTKKQEKKYRYKDHWFISNVLIDRKTYYSIDGLSFNHSRTDRISLEKIIRNYDLISIGIVSIHSPLSGVTITLKDVTSIDACLEKGIITLKIKP